RETQLGVTNDKNPVIEVQGSTIEVQGSTFTSNAENSVFNRDVYLNGNLAMTKLRGTGKAYACLDSKGALFRSNTQCR
ncbi:MAG: hypothetical protein AABX55_01385, partial [Nanoarchaeota archaeon]